MVTFKLSSVNKVRGFSPARVSWLVQARIKHIACLIRCGVLPGEGRELQEGRNSGSFIIEACKSEKRTLVVQ